MIKLQPPFDPNETKDYTINWTDELDAYSDTIKDMQNDGASFIVLTQNSGLSVVSTSIDSTSKKAVVWLTASNITQLNALVGSSVLLDHTIKTSGGRTLNETISLKIRSK